MPDQQHVSADLLPSDDRLRALEEEKGAIVREYEAKIADLQSQFSKEQCDKAALQEEFAKLQQARDAQLAEAQVNNVQSCGIVITIVTIVLQNQNRLGRSNFTEVQYFSLTMACMYLCTTKVYD